MNYIVPAKLVDDRFSASLWLMALFAFVLPGNRKTLLVPS